MLGSLFESYLLDKSRQFLLKSPDISCLSGSDKTGLLSLSPFWPRQILFCWFSERDKLYVCPQLFVWNIRLAQRFIARETHRLGEKSGPEKQDEELTTDQYLCNSHQSKLFTVVNVVYVVYVVTLFTLIVVYIVMLKRLICMLRCLRWLRC